MSVLSFQFAGFVVITFLIYHLIPWGWKRGWLLIASYTFYSAVDIRYAIVLLILTIGNFVLASRENKKNLISYNSIALFINLLSFGLLKWLTSPYVLFTGFITEKWILPVGFSFYLLQLLSFQLDVRHKKIKEMPTFWDFALFLAYFPKLLSGPIEKPSTFIPKIKEPIIVTNEVIGRSFGLILNGLIRKILIANLLQILVPPLFVLGQNPLWISLIAYTILLYNDFAGYTSVVRGVSLLFGIELSSNFQEPYLARNFSEFWSRWHISLTIWLRETIFFPLSRNYARMYSRSGNISGIILPPLITMFVSGLWHGLTLAMLAWGFAHGLLLIFERLIYEKWPQVRPSRLSISGQFVSRVITFFFISLGWVPFSSPGLQQSIEAFKGLFLNPVVFSKSSQTIPFLLIGLSFLLDIVSQNSSDELWWKKATNPAQAIGVSVSLMLLIAAISFQTQEPVRAFIYQGF